MTSPLPSITPTELQDATGELGWLLVNFLEEVPGSTAAVLGTLDGLALASAGLARPQDEHLAAVAASLHSPAKAGGNITDPPGGDVEHAIVKLKHKYLFVMNTMQGDMQGDMQGEAAEASGATVAGTLLTVLAAPDADTHMVGSEMARLVTSVARHLGTTTRTSSTDSSTDAGAATGAATGATAGAGDEG